MDDQNDPGNVKQRKPYQKPTARQLSQNEARLKLLEGARGGDQAAMELLELMFPEEGKKLTGRGAKEIGVMPGVTRCAKRSIGYRLQAGKEISGAESRHR